MQNDLVGLLERHWKAGVANVARTRLTFATKPQLHFAILGGSLELAATSVS
jgi:hypothetical protein